MKNTILQSDSEETFQLEDDLLKAKINLYKNNFEFINKTFYFYDAPELKNISKTAIITDDLILINIDYFKEIEKGSTKNNLNLSQMKLLQSLANNTDITHEKFSPKKLLKILNDNGYTEPAQKIEDILLPDSENYKLSQKDIKYVEEFINKKFPEAIHQFKKNKNFNELVDFVTKSVRDITALNDILYSLVTHQFGDHNMKNCFGTTLNYVEKTAIVKVLGAAADNEKRFILINEISGIDSFKSIANRTISSPKINNEPSISINNTQLNEGEIMTLRGALEAFESNLKTNSLGDDEHGKKMTSGYLKNIESIRELIYSSPPVSNKPKLK